MFSQAFAPSWNHVSLLATRVIDEESVDYGVSGTEAACIGCSWTTMYLMYIMQYAWVINNS